MIRGFVMIALGGALLTIGAVPALATSAEPSADTERPAAQASDERARPATPRAGREMSDTREPAAARTPRRSPSLPHPFRAQVLPEARV